jgi:endonuclease YncB( thermonuclease family)
MFGWGRRRDGFEWHKYVRTTIKLRREDRKARIRQAGAAIADAGRAGAAVGASGLRALIAQGSRQMLKALRSPSAVLGGLFRPLAAAARPIRSFLSRPRVAWLLLVVASAAIAYAAARGRAAGLDWEARGIGGIGIAALVVALLGVAGRSRLKLPPALARARSAIVRRLPAPTPGVGLGMAVAGVVGLLVGIAWLLPVRTTMPQLSSLVMLPTLSKTVVEGRATAVTGGTLRIKDKTVQLDGIEAPDLEQRCTRAGKRWRCGEAAAEALGRILRGKNARCEIGRFDASGRANGSCTIDGRDIAQQLVREGAVFASGGLFTGYGSAEREAKAQNAGLWAGEAERPSEFRAKLWEAAKRAAPDGCPIKGTVSSDGKIYVLPWSPEYVRARVRTSRGERWFCTEAEAQAAGWKAAQRG